MFAAVLLPFTAAPAVGAAPPAAASPVVVSRVAAGPAESGRVAAGGVGAGPRVVIPAGAVRGPVTVTLLTGDRVTLPSADAGSGAVRPGAGRAGIRFLTTREGSELYVIPADAQRLLRTGKLDRRLFNVTALARAGYHDAARDNLPLIISYAPGAARPARTALDGAGARVTRELPAIDGAAVQADKDRTGAFWAAVTADAAGARAGDPTAGATAGVERIWLDGKRRLMLDHSVPQIGAPAAHQAGFTGRGVTVAVLDTGIDANHPDLAGKVADARNFSEAPAPGDTVGHGTHVASTIAGSGAASGGRYRGVAPDATLISGKVCEADWCTESAMLAGLQWAAAEKRATVVNMSIGGPDGPEIDPLEEAVNTLTEQTGTLFVISAGNDGEDGSVASPGSAEAALTVGAIDRDEELADFSSRGPRAGDDAIKPDITAPGVDIVAARAAGTTLGEPAGQGYVAASGTSMAAPHVAGAVALLAQQHPDWAAGRLKATLMASARPNPALTAYQQGAGRVDVARAIVQTVTTEPTALAFGRTIWPHADDEPVARTVTYRNPGPAPLTLELALRVTGPERAAAPVGMFRLGAERITAPAGGTASVTIVADTSVASADGYWSGQLVATAGDVVVNTPVGVHKEVESYDLTVRAIDADGAPATEWWTEVLWLSEWRSNGLYAATGTVAVRLPKGRYDVSTWIGTARGEEQLDDALVVLPELNLTADRSVTVDARRARPVRVTVPAPAGGLGMLEVSRTHFTPLGSSTFGLLSTNLDGVASAQLGPSLPPDEFVGSIGGQWVEGEAGGDPAAHSRYLYAVQERFPGTLPTGYVRRYQARELAVVQQQFLGRTGPGEAAIRFVFGFYDGGGGAWGLDVPTALPGRRTEYYNADAGLRWYRELVTGTLDEMGWLDWRTYTAAEPAGYRPGHRYQDQWNGAPYGLSFPVTEWPESGVARQGDTLLLDVPLFSDTAGHAGFSLVEDGRTALYRNGKLVGEEPRHGFSVFEVPPGEAGYRLETSATRGSPDLTSRIDVAWTFRSGHVAGDEWAKLPAMAVRFTPKLDAGNAAPGGRTFDIPVTVAHQPGAPATRVKSLTVEVSYDDGRTWRTAELRRDGTARWVARVRHPAGAGYASLRARATDSRGGTVSQTVLHAYELK